MKDPYAPADIDASPSASAIVERRIDPPQHPMRFKKKWLGRTLGVAAVFITGIGGGAGALKVKNDRDARQTDLSHRTQLEAVNDETGDLKRKYEELALQMQTLATHNQDLQTRLNQEAQRGEELQSRLAQETERNNELLQRVTASEDRNRGLTARNERLASKVNRLEDTVETLRRQGGARPVHPIARPDFIRERDGMENLR